MKLDANALRYLSRDDWRVLTAVELGQKNHEIVPTPLIESIAKLKHGGVSKSLSTCLKHKLLHHDGAKYDGYRLTTLGYDFLAIHTLTMRGVITSVGRQIGVGKESDLFEVAAEDGTVMALKLHRLGRTSFRAVKSKRDYLRKGNHYSWLYLSRLAAIKEFAFMKALGERGLPVPAAIDHNRHAVLMQLIEGDQLAQVKEFDDPGVVFEEMVQIMCDMVRVGLVHCDFNEFNVIIGPQDTLIAIDFPQMVSVSHLNARCLFERDLRCIIRFFEKKMGYHVPPDVLPVWDELLQEAAKSDTIDVMLHASGFNHEDGDAIIDSSRQQPGRNQPAFDRSSYEASNEASSDDAESSIDISIKREPHVREVSKNEHCAGVEGLCIQDPDSPGSAAWVEKKEAQPSDLSPANVSDHPICTCEDRTRHAPAPVDTGQESDGCVGSDYGDTLRDKAGRRHHVATSQQDALAQLHRKAKAQAKRQGQIKASRNVVKQKGRKKHALQSLF